MGKKAQRRRQQKAQTRGTESSELTSSSSGGEVSASRNRSLMIIIPILTAIGAGAAYFTVGTSVAAIIGFVGVGATIALAVSSLSQEIPANDRSAGASIDFGRRN